MIVLCSCCCAVTVTVVKNHTGLKISEPDNCSSENLNFVFQKHALVCDWIILSGAYMFCNSTHFSATSATSVKLFTPALRITYVFGRKRRGPVINLNKGGNTRNFLSKFCITKYLTTGFWYQIIIYCFRGKTLRGL